MEGMPPKLMSDSKAWNRRSFFGNFPPAPFWMNG
jgi:hypothetical protein